MRNFLGRLFAGVLLLTSTTSLASFTPVGTHGQNQATPWETSRLLVPNSQATLTGTKRVLVETGNSNVLANPGFEHGTVATGWTTAGTAVAETTEIAAGKKSLKITLAAYTGDILVQSYTPTEKWFGFPIKASAAIKTSLSDLQFCLRINSVDLDCTDISNANVFQEYLAAMPGQDGVAHAIVLKSTSSVTGDVYIDKSELGIWPGAKSGIVYHPWTSYTPAVIVSSGSITNYTITGQWMRIGENAFYRGELTFTGSPGTWSTPQISIPSGQTVIYHIGDEYLASMSFIDNGTNFYGGEARLTGSGTRISVGSGRGTNGAGIIVTQAAPFTWASGDRMFWSIGPVQISEWTGNGSMNYTTNPVMDFNTIVYRGTNQTGVNPNSSSIKVLYNTIDSNFQSSSFNTSSSRYEAKVTGIHFVNANIAVQSSNVLANRYQLRFLKNGATIVHYGSEYMAATTTAFTLSSGSIPIWLNAGDYVETFLYGSGNNSSSTLTIDSTQAYTNMSVIAPNSAKNVTVPMSVTTPYLGRTVINNHVSKSANYTATDLDETITFTADSTLSLPAASGLTGKIYYVYNSGSGTETVIDPNSSETVCGNATITLAGDGDSIAIQSNGTNWIGLNGGCTVTRSTYIEYSVGTPSATNQNPNGWVSSVTDVNTGRFIIVPKSNIFSGLPHCTGLTRDSTASLYYASDSGQSWTNNSIPFVVGAPTDVSGGIVCHGRR